MAALERPVPSPEAFLGQPWAAWVREAAPPHAHDMHLFGHYPAHDDFYLVVCNICNQVVKPQVFQSHCGNIDQKREEPVSASGFPDGK
uniref:Ataxin-7-like protein 1 n=1 Tax=Nothoprocta perdicaria TaxID=30464 RepID=A0A8C7A8I4_NOTPE